ncbi:hypothetical protein GGR52DRAFT_577049 [Hypoxylon sp. FL1284]|nr:hypothetical protein GGR52DRAFT_577049 [Hypoxylon sp. FL1284]
MERRHPPETVHLVIQSALPNVTVESINALPTYRLTRYFSIKVSDGRTLLLSLPPPPTLRLLRSERAVEPSETAVTRWILETVLESQDQRELVRKRLVASGPLTEDSSQNDERTIVNREIQDLGNDALKYLPIPIVHSTSAELGSTFNLFEVPRGCPIAELATPLTRSERQMVDFQQGRFVRQLSGFTSPNGTFGPAIAVIASDIEKARRVNIGFRGVNTWRYAFHSMMEAVLRDAEDMAITISYELIRGYFNRLGHLLDSVTVARLVILDASDESNVLVLRDDESDHTQSDEESEQLNTNSPTIRVTGLRDWSSCIFGDPLVAEVFSRGPTTEFLRGFRQPTTGTSSSPQESGAPSKEEDNNEDIYDASLVEDRENAATRLLLYSCYHATTDIVRCFYRPGPGTDEREMAARRRLAAVLARLAEADEETAGKRARRFSANGGESWPVKKARGDGDSPLPSIESSGEPMVKVEGDYIKQEDENL